MTWRLLGLFCAGLVLAGGSGCARPGKPNRAPGRTFVQAASEPGIDFQVFKKVKIYALAPLPGEGGKAAPDAGEIKLRRAALKELLEKRLAQSGHGVLAADAMPDVETMIIRISITSWKPASRHNPFSRTRAAIEVSAADAATGSIIAEISDKRSARDAEGLIPGWADDLGAYFAAKK